MSEMKKRQILFSAPMARAIPSFLEVKLIAHGLHRFSDLFLITPGVAEPAHVPIATVRIRLVPRWKRNGYLSLILSDFLNGIYSVLHHLLDLLGTCQLAWHFDPQNQSLAIKPASNGLTPPRIQITECIKVSWC